MLTVKGKNNEDGTFNWKDALIDAGIMAGLTFCMTLSSLASTGAITLREVAAAGLAAAYQFFSVLALKRGLREKPKK